MSSASGSWDFVIFAALRDHDITRFLDPGIICAAAVFFDLMRVLVNNTAFFVCGEKWEV